MSKLKVLVLGGSGQLGQAFAARIESSDVEVHLPRSRAVDVRNADVVARYVDQITPDYVINGAAFTAVERAESERDVAFAINADGAKNVAVACERAGAHLIHVSTDYVFDGESRRPYLETDVAKPLNVYGESKLLGEQLVAVCAPRSCILRVSWVFGASPNSFVEKILVRALRNEPLRVVDDQQGCPTSASGIAEALVRIVSTRARPTGLFHYCGKPETTWFGFATEIVRHAHRLGVLKEPVEVMRISSAQLNSATRRPAYTVLDTTKIETELAIRPDAWLARLPSACTSSAPDGANERSPSTQRPN